MTNQTEPACSSNSSAAVSIRPDVAELLYAGHSDAAIGRQLHTDPKGVAIARATLGLPKAKSGYKAAASPEDLFWRRVAPLEDGHMEWTGYRGGRGLPSLRHGGRNFSAYGIAFRIATGREPKGNVRPSCGRDGCVQPGHHADQASRARASARAAAARTWARGLKKAARAREEERARMARAREREREKAAHAREKRVDALYVSIFGAAS